MIDPVIMEQFPHYADPGDRVRYEQRLGTEHRADPRFRIGFGTVKFEWLAMDCIAVKVLTDGGRTINLLPELGDRIKVIDG